jgi:TPP-dependent pyruvate/acetoin dehydrogenase alpha subunit
MSIALIEKTHLELGGQQPSSSELLEMYRLMILIRTFENKIKELYSRGEVLGDPHLSSGQEAVAVGVCSVLEKSDYITSTHRAHGHSIAKGADINKLFAEVLGKKTGFCGGKGGTMHLADISVGLLCTCPIIGAGMPLALGAGLSAKLRGTNQVTVAFFGDGGNNQGTFHESLNLASIWKLPVIFVCENNQYAEATRVEAATAAKISDRGIAYSIPGIQVDGMDVLAIYGTMKEAVKRARTSLGPTLIEAVTYRYEGHTVRDDWSLYRSKEEIDRWKMKDPITNFQKDLFTIGILDEEKSTDISKSSEKIVERAYDFAMKSPEPEISEAFSDVFVTPDY